MNVNSVTMKGQKYSIHLFCQYGVYPHSGHLHQIDKNACYHSKLDLNFKLLLPAHRPYFVTPVL